MFMNQNRHLCRSIFFYFSSASYPIVLFLLVGCNQRQSEPPVIDAWQVPSSLPKIYQVQRGDTLFSVAWHYDLDFFDLAQVNHLSEPFRLHVGQALQIAPASKAQSANLRRSANHEKAKRVKSDATFRQQHGLSATIRWNWPVKSQVIADYAVSGNKGIDFTGKTGDAVTAAAAGKVVYSGSGLPGYGNLIIVRHTNQYLSAYAHNRNIFVKEGQMVKLGEKIADIGNTAANQVKLHFEIRKQGKPLNPRKLLPVR